MPPNYVGRVATAPPQIPGLSDWRALARGGFSTVWQAKQESLNRFVAVKVDQRPLDVEAEQRRFLREAGAAGRLSGHPGIVTVHDAGILADDRPFLVMELCPGGSLTKWMTADPRPSQRRVRDVGVRVADALAAAHVRGVLHRDVKPANILIDAYNNPGLADFGLAALPDPGMGLSETLDAITPAYAPPEVFRREPFTEYGDVYSLAATLYALLNGRPPRELDGKTPSIDEIMDLQQKPIARIPGVDPKFMDQLLAALADVPTDRPSAAQFRDRLAALSLSHGTPELPAKPERTAPVRRPVTGPEVVGALPTGRGERSRSLLVLGLVLVVLVIALIVTVVNLRSRPVETVGGPGAASASNAAPQTTPSATPGQPSATPPPIPNGFTDCSNQLGAATFCAAAPECWAGVISVSDVPSVATAQACPKRHVYQTFAAGRLGYEVRRQSKLEADRNIGKICRPEVVNAMLRKEDRRSDWEVLVIGPQLADETFYRCLFGRGYASKAYPLSPP